MKILNRIYVDSDKGRKLYFELNDGSLITEMEAISGIKSGKIYGSNIVKRNGKETVIGLTPIKTIYKKHMNKSLNSINSVLYSIPPVSSSDEVSFFKRDLYKDLLDWKNNRKNVSLFLQGPRQVGKTSLLREFGKKEFKNVLYIDLKDKKSLDLLTHYYNDLSGKISLDSFESYRLLWYNIFKNYSSSFIDNSDTLIILDEIQESPLFYNSIRYMNRYLNARVCITGSYIAITKYKSEYSRSAGDVKVLNLNSLNFKEFLDAVGIYDSYSKISSIVKSELSLSELEIYKKVEDYYNVYLQIGGYPAVVSHYLETGDIKSCYEVINSLLTDYFSESDSYLSDIIESAYLPSVCYLVSKDLITHQDNLQINDVPYLFGKSYSHFKLKREDKMNGLGWLWKSKIVDGCSVLSNLDLKNSSDFFKYYFNDVGFLSFIYQQYYNIPLSDIKGTLAENFVYLFIRDNFTNLNKIDYISTLEFYSFDSTKNEIDFLVRYNNSLIGIEVKYNKGSVKSSDKYLSNGRLDWVIKVMNTFGGVNSDVKKTTIPIFAIDKMFNYPPFV